MTEPSRSLARNYWARMLLANEVTQARLAAGLTQNVAAGTFGVSTASISRQENGLHFIRRTELTALAELYIEDNQLRHHVLRRWLELQVMAKNIGGLDVRAPRPDGVGPMEWSMQQAMKFEAGADRLVIIGGSGFGPLTSPTLMVLSAEHALDVGRTDQIANLQQERLSQLSQIPEIKVIIDEAALVRLAAGPTGEEQLRILNGLTNGSVQVLPLSQGVATPDPQVCLQYDGLPDVFFQPSNIDERGFHVAIARSPVAFQLDHATRRAQSSALDEGRSRFFMNHFTPAFTAGQKLPRAAETVGVSLPFSGQPRMDLDIAELFEKLVQWGQEWSRYTGTIENPSPEDRALRQPQDSLEKMAAIAAAFRVARVEELTSGYEVEGFDRRQFEQRVEALPLLRHALLGHEEGDAITSGRYGTETRKRVEVISPEERLTPETMRKATALAEEGARLLEARSRALIETAPPQDPAFAKEKRSGYVSEIRSSVAAAARFAAVNRALGRDLSPENKGSVARSAADERSIASTIAEVPAYADALKELSSRYVDARFMDDWDGQIEAATSTTRRNVGPEDENGPGRDIDGGGGTRPDTTPPTVTGPTGGAAEAPQIERHIEEKGPGHTPESIDVKGSEEEPANKQTPGNKEVPPPAGFEQPSASWSAPPGVTTSSITDGTAVPHLPMLPKAPPLNGSAVPDDGSTGPMARPLSLDGTEIDTLGNATSDSVVVEKPGVDVSF